MRLVVVGAGYVGLVTGTGLSDLGHEVLVIDREPSKVEQLAAGNIPIYEPGLGDLVRRNKRNGRLTFATEIPQDWAAADAFFIAVGTPASPDGAADTSAVFDAASAIAKIALRSAIVVVKSTVPVGTCDAVQAHIDGGTRQGVELEVVSNPEFLKEGDAVNDFFRPERIVVGARSEEARRALRALYAPLQLSGERLVITDPRSSELIKYAANTMLAMRVSFMNELSRLCHATGADIHAVRLGVGSDSRIGKKFLYSGPGYGGSCFPKDVQALLHLGKVHGIPMRLAEATHQANEEQGDFLAHLVERMLTGTAGGSLAGKTVAFWGLAFKPETDDVRDAPSVRLARHLAMRGARVVGHDPEAGPNFLRALSDVTAARPGSIVIVDKDYDAVEGADALVLLTEWRSYRAPNFAEVKKRLATPQAGQSPVVFDARNIWRPSEVLAAGLRYQGIGVPSTGSTVATPPASSRALS
jgi:UDPglucose 6-dehydrogenase